MTHHCQNNGNGTNTIPQIRIWDLNGINLAPSNTVGAFCVGSWIH
jgi:hypothetical protein